MPKKYEQLFFDLDRTLWDFEKSALQTFDDLYEKYRLQELGVPTVEDFHRVYTRHNNALWEKYRAGKIEKKVLSSLRYQLTLEEFGIRDKQLAVELGKDYLFISPRKVNLFPHAIEVLEYLAPRYPLHLITNGFSEVQDTKLEVSGLGRFFRTVTTSEEAGVKKPHAGIFELAMKKAGAEKATSLMIGDDAEVDIVGARNFGMDQVLFDPHGLHGQNGSTFYIRSLDELTRLL